MLTNPMRGLGGRLKIMANRARRKEGWQADAKILWERWRNDPLFVMGVGLYWGEGTKSPKCSVLAMTNSDARLLQVWHRWCARFMPGVPLDYSLRIHDNCDVKVAQEYWKEQLGVHVQVVSVAVSCASKRLRNTLPYGTIKIRVGPGTVEWYTKMMVWLELAQQL